MNLVNIIKSHILNICALLNMLNLLVQLSVVFSF